MTWNPGMTYTEHHLNYFELAPGQFEELAFWLLEAQGHTDVDHLGAAGSEKGCDVVSRGPDGKPWVTQCKRVQSFGKAEALKELQKVLDEPPDPPPGVYFLVATCAISRTVKEALKKKLDGAMELKTWDLTKLDKRVREHPDVVKRFFGVAPAAPEPKKLWTVPYRRNPYFVGREEILDQLRERLTQDGTAALGQTQAIYGLGGIGKTQTAVEYAYRYRDEYQAVFFIRADTEAEILTGFSELARELGLGEAKEQEQVVAAVLAWLKGNDGWLLIFDNADTPELVKPYLPADHRGHVLVTSRARVFVTLGIAEPFEMATLPPSEALEFLLKRAAQTAPNPEERAAAEALVGELGDLPLALEQAGAYILEKQARFQDYLRSYRKRGLELLELGRPQVEGHPEPVATTWSMNFREVEETSQASAEVLRASAFLSPHAIPLEILRKGGSELGPNLAKTLVREQEDCLVIDEILEPLTKYSLISKNAEGRTYSFHRLVQEVMKAEMEAPSRRDWVERTIRALNRTFPDVEFAGWALCGQLVHHVQAILTPVAEFELELRSAAWLFDRAGSYLFYRARYEEAEVLYQRSLEITEKAYGKKHCLFATALNNLGLLYSAESRYREAKQLYQHSLEIKVKALGKRHPEVAQTLANMGALSRSQGCYKEAKLLFKRALQIYEEVFGTHHIEVGRVLEWLGVLFDDLGRYGDAKRFYLRSLGIKEQMLGKDHPEVAETLKNVGEIYRRLARYEKAEPLLERSLRISENALGKDHPDVATVLESMGLLYSEQGRHEEVELLYLRCLEIYERAWGKEHPALARFLNNLAILYHTQGRHEEAEPLIERSLKITENALGKNHPNVAAALNSLGLVCVAQGDLAKAERLYHRCLKITEEALAKDHPDVAKILYNLGNLYSARGRYEETEPLYRSSLEIKEKAVGKDHPDVAQTLNNLGNIYIYQRRFGEADRCFHRSFRINEKVLGKDHPEVALTLNNLGFLYSVQGRYEEAEPHYVRSLQIREKALGKDHPSYTTTLRNYAALLRETDREDEAAELEAGAGKSDDGQ